MQKETVVDALNGAKLDLALAVSLCVAAALLAAALPLARWIELAALALIAVAAAGWVMLRTRRVMHRFHAAGANEGHDGTQQK
jgi:hypothetical protein